MEIEWRKINGWDGYEVSRCGLVRSFKLGDPFTMKQHKKNRGNGRGNQASYFIVWLSRKDANKNLSVHRLVCTAFHPNPENKPQVNHIDGNSLNNHADNLEWCTAKENTLHAWKIGLCKVKNPISKEKIDYIVKNYVRLGSKILAEELGIIPQMVLKHAKRNGADISKAQNKKVINTDTAVVYNSIDELCKITGESKKTWRRRLSNERPNRTPFRYVDNRGNITAAKEFEIKPRYISPRIVKPIAVFDINWNELERFQYIGDAALFVGGETHAVNEFLNGKREQHKGHKFKLLDENGNYIEPIPFISKKKSKKIKIRGEVSPPKEVEQYTPEGLFVDRYGSIGLAAKYLGVDKKQFRRQIAKSPTGYARGYNWKVID